MLVVTCVTWRVACAGERDRLVPAAQEHGAADDLQGEDGPRESEERPVQPTHDLPAADAQQGDGAGVDPPDRVLGLHLPQQVTMTTHS